ncbi:WcaI family glycosyltransferase [Croceibacterium sp. TMG7-5b_MA50]|uniref:WcaI family glycosyltransferase n=1 Tax=Croceibacterium sp. TMG7-5b_MA50 TaxID=3121290 RepID=UPI003221E935
MHILILGLNYAPEPVGVGPYTAGLAEGLAVHGHRVEVLAGVPYYPQWRLAGGYANRRCTTEEQGVKVTRVPHYIPARPSGAQRLLHHASFAASVYGPAMAAARERPDLVLAIAPSLMSVPVAARVAKRADAPLWVHVQDFEVDAAFATGLLSSTAARLEQRAHAIERAILKQAAMVSTISPQMCALLASKGVARERIYEMRNWSNADFSGGTPDPSRYRSEWGIGDRHVALYSGNIANKQGLEVVIDAARALANRRDIAFVICGEGPNRANLQQQAEGLDNIQFHDLQPAERMAEFLSLASVHLLPQKAEAADLVLPSKLTNMLASGRPVIATAAPETGLHAEVEDCGINTPPGDGLALAEAVTQLVDDPARRQAMGAAARIRAVERWSKTAIIAAAERRMLPLTKQRAR